ncbi:MAG: DUF6931 family protein [Marinibacterium sp.]
MSDRFDNLKRIPPEPALRFLALANATLMEKTSSPASASVPVLLAELEEKEATIDMLRLLAAALPPREAIWWGCLAAGDLVPEGSPVPKSLQAARDWVFTPSDDTRNAARAAAESAPPDDETTLAATAVAMCDGKLGTGDLAAHDAPPGAVAVFVFGLNAKSLAMADPTTFQDYGRALVDRALDIARGGDGQGIVLPQPEPETEEEPMP